jgi:Lon protease-like protein
MEALGPLALPYPIGCTARVIQVEPLEDGRINLTVVGDERFKILHTGNALPYLSAFVESLPLKSHHSLEVVRGTHLLRKRVTSYLSLLAQITENEDEVENLDLHFDLTDLQLPDDPMMLIYLAAALLQVPPNEKQPLLEADTAAKLLEHIQRLYRRELAVLPAVITTSEDQARSSAWAN